MLAMDKNIGFAPVDNKSRGIYCSIFVNGFPTATLFQTAIRTILCRWTYFTFSWRTIAT